MLGLLYAGIAAKVEEGKGGRKKEGMEREEWFPSLRAQPPAKKPSPPTFPPFSLSEPSPLVDGDEWHLLDSSRLAAGSGWDWLERVREDE